MTVRRMTTVLQAEGITLRSMAEALNDAGAQFVALLRSAPASSGHQQVPHMKWTAAETAAHMATILRRGTKDFRRAESLQGLAELNDLCISEVESRDLHELAEIVEKELARLGRGIDPLDEETAASLPFELHAGVTANVPSALSYVLFDFLGHGWDIAQALGLPWVIRPHLAALDLHAALPIYGPWARADVVTGSPQRLAVVFGADDDALVVEVGNGTYRAANKRRDDVDGVVEVDPVEAFLTVSGRGSSADPTITQLASWFEPT